MWNGRVLVLHEFAITDGVLRGAYLETDFASFLAWRDWGYPDQSVRNCFAMGAVRASDGSLLWNYPLAGGAFNAPTLVGKTVYVGAANSMAYALRTDNGKLLWHYLTQVGG